MNTSPSHLTIAARHGNLFIGLDGDFGPETAASLLAAIECHYPGRGNIFINTEKAAVLPAGRKAFRERLGALPASNLYFIGAGGFELSPDGGRVIIRRPKKRRCAGCRNCSCTERSGRPAAGPAPSPAAPFFDPPVRVL
jgi:hypothetical protein